MFFARVPQTFLDKFIALKVDPSTGKPNPALFSAFNAAHPEVQSQVQFLNSNNPPRSYANEAYFGIHTFFLVDATGKRSKFKFHFEPKDGINRLTDAEVASGSDGFLEPALVERMKSGPASWDLVITLGMPGDEELDPTVLWPPDRPQIRAGTLRLHDALPSEKAGSFKINYDPMMLSEGIAASKDPILLFRSPSYAISHGRRLQGL
jgi:catalase